MTKVRLIERPAFWIAGVSTWIGGPENDLFGEFWLRCKDNGTLERLACLRDCNNPPGGAQTHSSFLGVSRVEEDPAQRAFFYMLAVELCNENGKHPEVAADLEVYQVPAATWAVFDCPGVPPDSIVQAEMFAFTQWLPSSGYRHALAPEMEVYGLSHDPNDCTFWLPVTQKDKITEKGSLL